MKDKSRFISSVIVSLLAGFIYFLSGQEIKQDLKSSIQAVFSENELEVELPRDCESFTSILQKSGQSIQKNKSKFYVSKKNTIEFRKGSVIIPGEKLVSGMIQARLKKSTPDKNLNFSAELEQLIKKDLANVPGKEFKIENSSEVVSTEDLKSKLNWIDKDMDLTRKVFELREFMKYNKGKGFEYNYIVEDNCPQGYNEKDYNRGNNNVYYQSNSNTNENTYTDCQRKCACNQENVKYNSNSTNKIKVVIPKFKSNVTGEEVETPVIEVKTFIDEVEAPETDCDYDEDCSDEM